ncbi:MAG TPA: hypothetical protein VI336_00780, partial [Candidatus Saccharimonadales bacterium]|nr:hypothetical protein [Candidatus Saccharimonadales bacterium]
MKTSFQISNFKFQTSNKLQVANYKCLNFGVWFLNFVVCGCVLFVDWLSKKAVKLFVFSTFSTDDPYYLTSQVIFTP